MKVHETSGGPKRKYKEQIALGKRVYIFLKGYRLSEEGLPKKMKDA